MTCFGFFGQASVFVWTLNRSGRPGETTANDNSRVDLTTLIFLDFRGTPGGRDGVNPIVARIS